jgi:hypothetical protein
MRFYNQTHEHYCGIDLHVKSMYVCILDAAGKVLVHRNVSSTPEAFREVVAPYRQVLVVAVECMLGRRALVYWPYDAHPHGGNCEAGDSASGRAGARRDVAP